MQEMKRIQHLIKKWKNLTPSSEWRSREEQNRGNSGLGLCTRNGGTTYIHSFFLLRVKYREMTIVNVLLLIITIGLSVSRNGCSSVTS